MRLRKQELAALDLDDLADVSDDQFQKQLEARNITNYSSWVLPQLVAIFGQWRLQSTGRATILENCNNNFQRACWRLTRLRRSYLVKNQTQQSEYGQFTPLVLLGFKRMQGFSYEQFRELPDLDLLLEPDLYEAVVLDQPPQLTKNRLLEIRQQGLEYKTGPKQGETRPAESTWQLYGIQDTELGIYPKLTQTMIAQCWLAHPKHRRATMILDPNDWDAMPEPLVEMPLTSKPATAKTTKPTGLPWLD